MALQVTFTDPATNEPNTAAYLKVVGVDTDEENPERSVVKLAVYVSAAAAASGKRGKYYWRVPIAHLVSDSLDLSDLNAVLGMPIPSLGLAGKPAYNALKANIYAWLKQPASADRLGYDFSGGVDV